MNIQNIHFLLCFVAFSIVSAKATPHISVSKGLQNLGNTCYLNTQIQCAYHIPAVRKLVLQPSNEDNAALVALRRLFDDMERQPLAVAPRHFCQVLGIPVMEQQDSSEFWKLLLPALQRKAISDLYQGAFQDYIVALDGSNRERKREEAFLDLSVDVSSGSLLKALQQQFREPELLSGDNGWRPEKGADKVDAHKGQRLLSQGLPPILQVHLKRFNFDWTTETMQKINDRFDFPSTIEIGDFCEDKSDTIYDLQGIIIHMGEFGSGHYYAYVRTHPRSDKWVRFNDHVTEEVSFHDVYVDACGGKTRRPTSSKDKGKKTKSGFISRLARAFGGSGSYGYGGQTSNAYVLQYVKRSDIPQLYDEK